MKRTIILAVLPVLLSTIITCGLLAFLARTAQAAWQETPLQTVTVYGRYSGMEQAFFEQILADFTARTGITATYSFYPVSAEFLLGCAASNTCPDLAIMNAPSLLSILGQAGAITPLDQVIPDFDLNFSAAWRSLGSAGGALNAVPLKAQSRSTIWYHPPTFDAISATQPLAWTDLLGLRDTFVSLGLPPFSIGAASGSSSGWPLSEWFHNILLGLGGPVEIELLANHRTAWTNPKVVAAMRLFGEIVGENEYQVGGITGTLNTTFSDAALRPFSTPPQGAMYLGASWVPGIIQAAYPELIPVQDFTFFGLPAINPAYGKPLLVQVDLAVLVKDNPAARQLIQYLATPEAAAVWAASGSNFSPNRAMDLSAYPTELARLQATQLLEAGSVAVAVDDQAPRELQGYIWGAMLDFVAHPEQLMGILQGLEDRATEIQGPLYTAFLPILQANPER